VDIDLRVDGGYLLWTKLKALREIGKVSFTIVIFTDLISTEIPPQIFDAFSAEQLSIDSMHSFHELRCLAFDVQAADELFAKLGG
jgi:hypothetical protein